MKIFRVLDTETTGLDGPPKGGVMEIAWTDVRQTLDDPHAGSIQARPVSYYCDPKLPCNVEALATHHITPDMIKGKPHFDAYRITLNQGADYLVAHNMAFDEKFIETTLPKICTMKCAMVAYPECPSFRNQVLRYFLELNLDPKDCEPVHAAGPDTWVTAHIFLQLLKVLTVDQMVTISAEPARHPRCPIGKWRGKAWSEVEMSYLAWMVNNPTMEKDLKWLAMEEIKRRRDSGL